MSRLIAFGCSFTYGHGLVDCHIPPNHPGPVPSKFAWPQLIADQLGLECINLGIPGNSNKQIWYQVSKFDFQKDDIVFIMWSYPERYTVLKDNEYSAIGIWQDSLDSKAYYNFVYSKFDSEYMSKLYVSHADYYLDDLGIKSYQFVSEPSYENILTLNNKTIPSISVYLNDWEFRNVFPKALDDKIDPGFGHPGEAAHLEFSRIVLNYLKVDHDIPKQNAINNIEHIKREFKFYSTIRWIKKCIRLIK